MPTKFIIWAGIEFQRKGSCTNCGQCCIGCVHYNPTIDTSIGNCEVWDAFDKVCPECSSIRGRDIYHSNCADYPQHPVLHLNRTKTCGFTFTRTDHGSMDDLPGLNDEPYDTSGG